MKYFLISLFIGIHAISAAQNIFSSPYSIYGLGIINKRMSTLNRGMAGTGIAIRDDLNLNYVNPASYSSILTPVSSIYEMGFYIENNNYKTNELTESKTTGSLTNLNYWFKFKPKWSSTIGLTPYSSVSYKVNSQRDLGGLSNLNYTYEGNGTLSQLYWGNAFSLMKNLSVGINISYLFGSISKSESVATFSQTSSLVFENKINATKFDMDFGLQYVLPLKKNRSLVIGLIGDDGVRFKANQKNYLYDWNSDTLDTSIGEKLSYVVPPSLGVGLALQSRRSIVSGDLNFEAWSKASFPEEELIFRDTWKFSLGYMYKGNPDADHYLGSVSLRSGLYAQQYYQRIKGNVLPWWGMSLGLSMPVFDNRSAVNITYSFDQLGTLNDGLILQRSQKIMFDVIIRDLWGIKRKFD